MQKIFRSVLPLVVVAAVAGTPASAGLSDIFSFFWDPWNDSQPADEPTESIVDLAVATPDLSTLVQAVLKADLAATLDEEGDFTVFAPTNAAFEAAGIDPAAVDKDTLTAVLLDHVAPGTFKAAFLRKQARAGERLTTLGGLTLGFDKTPLSVNGNLIVIRNIKASNGRIHVIDGVLTRPAPSIADRAIATESLSTLVDAAVKAGLVPTLDGSGPYTAFVPTNGAFERAGIDPAAIDAATLGAVLSDHVVPGEFTSSELASLRVTSGTLRTLGGLDLSFRLFPFRVNGIRILATNISADNGIIFVIDGVLLEE